MPIQDFMYEIYNIDLYLKQSEACDTEIAKKIHLGNLKVFCQIFFVAIHLSPSRVVKVLWDGMYYGMLSTAHL